jgi:hypothetical protein
VRSDAEIAQMFAIYAPGFARANPGFTKSYVSFASRFVRHVKSNAWCMRRIMIIAGSVLNYAGNA